MGNQAVPHNVRYRMVKTVECIEDHGNIPTYGICCREDIREKNKNKVKYHLVPDISTRSGFVEELVERLIRHDVAPVHLLDIIYDYLP